MYNTLYLMFFLLGFLFPSIHGVEVLVDQTCQHVFPTRELLAQTHFCCNFLARQKPAPQYITYKQVKILQVVNQVFNIYKSGSGRQKVLDLEYLCVFAEYKVSQHTFPIYISYRAFTEVAGKELSFPSADIPFRFPGHTLCIHILRHTLFLVFAFQFLSF